MGWASAAISIGSAVIGARNQKKAADQSQQMAEWNAKMQRAETAEAARRLAKTQDQTRALAMARAAASGVKVEGSSEIYMKAMSEEMDKELRWLREAGVAHAAGESLSGKYAQQQGKWNAIGTIVGGINQAGSSLGWWS